MYLHILSAHSTYCLPQYTFSGRKEDTDDESTNTKLQAVDHLIVEDEDFPPPQLS